jgi:heparanase
METPLESKRYTLSADSRESREVKLNGEVLKLTEKGDLPSLDGEVTAAGRLTFPPATITFLSLQKAGNDGTVSCSELSDAVRWVARSSWTA